MKDEKNKPKVNENSLEITHSDALARYNELYNNDTYQAFKRASAGLDIDYNDFIDAAIDLCQWTLSRTHTGKFLEFVSMISNERNRVFSAAYDHFLNFASKEAIDKISQEPLEVAEVAEAPEVDYKELSEALRQDMLEASNTLTRLFDILTRMSEYDGLHADVIIDMVKQDINKALLTLGCVDHLPDESDGNATP